MLFTRGVLVIPDIFLNAGGVTVSYFEWLKNLEHVRFGRMEKRFADNAFRGILEAVGTATNQEFPSEIMAKVAKGADEEDLVRSGLEETMSEAYRQINMIRRQHSGKIDLRTSAFVSAINKIATSYKTRGIFP